MNPLVIVLVVVGIVVVAALVATNPMMRRREDGAIAAVKESLSGLDLIEPRTTAMGVEPEEAGGLRGMVCLGLDRDELLAVTWVGGTQWRVPRASVTAVDTPADDPGQAAKATITVTYSQPEGGDATAMFRLRDAADWLTALGYDWGPDGPPVPANGDEPDEPGDSDESAES
jgi:hypothetical protein